MHPSMRMYVDAKMQVDVSVLVTLYNPPTSYTQFLWWVGRLRKCEEHQISKHCHAQCHQAYNHRPKLLWLQETLPRTGDHPPLLINFQSSWSYHYHFLSLTMVENGAIFCRTQQWKWVVLSTGTSKEQVPLKWLWNLIAARAFHAKGYCWKTSIWLGIQGIIQPCHAKMFKGLIKGRFIHLLVYRRGLYTCSYW